MKRFGFIILALLALSSIVLIGYSKSNEVSVITEAIPESITRIEASGFYSGELEPWELTEAEIEELNTWVPQLSLKHRTYAEGETPNRVYNGGICYTFAINDGEMSFSWIYIDKPYIQYDGEWYEITNTKTPPLDLAGPGKPGK